MSFDMHNMHFSHIRAHNLQYFRLLDVFYTRTHSDMGAAILDMRIILQFNIV
jgi:hypothetical protein